MLFCYCLNSTRLYVLLQLPRKMKQISVLCVTVKCEFYCDARSKFFSENTCERLYERTGRRSLKTIHEGGRKENSIWILNCFVKFFCNKICSILTWVRFKYEKNLRFLNGCLYNYFILHLDLENNKKFDLKKTSSHPNSWHLNVLWRHSPEAFPLTRASYP